MNAPLIVKLLGGDYINLSALTYINSVGQIAFVGDDVYQMTGDETAALRRWLDLYAARDVAAELAAHDEAVKQDEGRDAREPKQRRPFIDQDVADVENYGNPF